MEETIGYQALIPSEQWDVLAELDENEEAAS